MGVIFRFSEMGNGRSWMLLSWYQEILSASGLVISFQRMHAC